MREGLGLEERPVGTWHYLPVSGASTPAPWDPHNDDDTEMKETKDVGTGVFMKSERNVRS